MIFKSTSGRIGLLGLLAPLVIHSAASAGTMYVGSQYDVIDTDSDGIPDRYDNAPYLSNPDQMDTDADQLGDPADPYPSFTDGDHDGVIDSADARPTDPLLYSILYTLGGSYTVPYGQDVNLSFTKSLSSPIAYDRVSVSVDGISNVATYLLAPTDTAINITAANLLALGITPSTPHTIGIESWYRYTPSGNSTEVFASITVVPEPTTAALMVGVPVLLKRRRQ